MERAVLVVEPDDTLRAEMCEYLSARGHRVDRVSSPREALVRARFTRFDAVFLNLDGPGGWGLAALRDLLAGAPPPAIIAVTVSAAAGAEAVRLGARTFLARPFALEDVAGAIEGPPRLRASAGQVRTPAGGVPRDDVIPPPDAPSPSRKLH